MDSGIVQAVIDLANAMGIATMAEGVETRDQVAELRRLGCDMALGYYFSPPLRAREFDEELARHFVPAMLPNAPAVSLPPGSARPAQLDAHHHQGRGQHQPRREDEQVATGHFTAPEFSERSLPVRAVSQPAADAIRVKCAWWRCGGGPSGRRELVPPEVPYLVADQALGVLAEGGHAAQVGAERECSAATP